MCASPRSIAISAKPRISRRRWPNCREKRPPRSRASERRRAGAPARSAVHGARACTRPARPWPHLAEPGGRGRYREQRRHRRPRLDPARRPAPCRGRGAAPCRRQRPAARRCTSRWSHARITASRRPAPTPSSLRGSSRVVSAIEDPNPEVAGKGHARLRAAGIAVEVGVGAAEARHDHAGHIRRMREGRPQVMLKLAISADGKAGAAGRKPIAITGEAVRDRVHLMRAQSDAVMVGIGTALADNPMLTCRLPGMFERSPVRVVFDSKLRLPLESRLVRSAYETPVWAIAGMMAPEAAEFALLPLGVEVLRSPESDDPLDLRDALEFLAAKGITRLMVEGGPMLAAAFIAADLVDEATLFYSQAAVGADGVEALASATMAALTQRLKRLSSEPVGADRQDNYVRE